VENAIEHLAATAWQELLPDQAEPPVFVTHMQKGRYTGTHLGEDGWTVPMLMALSGHTNPRSLAIYVQPSAEAVARELGRRDRNRRRRR
jgi:hypothetical protein